MILLLLIIILIILLFINFQCSESFENTDIPYIFPMDNISISPVGDRGVIASKDYKEGDILEVCPCIKQENTEIRGRINDYAFSFDEKHSLIAFGYCSMYNHSDDNNASWKVLNENQMIVKAKKNIKKGEEIFVSYGTGYWNTRGMKKKII
jgi:SET domain-containing protein